MTRLFRIGSLVVGAVTIGALAFLAGRRSDVDRWIGQSIAPIPGIPFEAVLDGDTVVDHGRAVHIRGTDAPELGPWAKCWAEAALAGKSKDELEQTLLDERGWHLVEIDADSAGRMSGRIVDRNGYDIADDMRVNGSVAITSGRWDWCGPNADLHNPRTGEEPPLGPNLWWPGGKMFDARAAD